MICNSVIYTDVIFSQFKDFHFLNLVVFYYCDSLFYKVLPILPISASLLFLTSCPYQNELYIDIGLASNKDVHEEIQLLFAEVIVLTGYIL